MVVRNNCACPDESDLECLATGRVPDGDADELERHIEGCPRCAAA